MASGPTITIRGKDYDLNRDFSWRELITIEDLSGVPLGHDGAFESLTVLGACVFVVLKRDDEKLKWEGFLDGNIDDITEDEPEPPAAKKGAAKRPPKPAA